MQRLGGRGRWRVVNGCSTDVDDGVLVEEAHRGSLMKRSGVRNASPEIETGSGSGKVVAGRASKGKGKGKGKGRGKGRSVSLLHQSGQSQELHRVTNNEHSDLRA